jgi:hypothetical protein
MTTDAELIDAIDKLMRPEPRGEWIGGTIVTIISDPYEELDAAMIDLRKAVNDDVTLATIKRVQDRIRDVQCLLEARD